VVEGFPGTFEQGVRSWARRVRALIAARERQRRPARASFDPVRVEDELYDALYGARTGTVENIAPLRAKKAREPANLRRARGDHQAPATRPRSGAAGRG